MKDFNFFILGSILFVSLFFVLKVILGVEKDFELKQSEEVYGGDDEDEIKKTEAIR